MNMIMVDMARHFFVDSFEYLPVSGHSLLASMVTLKYIPQQ